MVARAHDDRLRWMAPHPLWLADASVQNTGLNGEPGRPAILRFATDAFMDELIALTATRPEALPAWLAVPETWRAPAPPPPTETLTPARPLSFARDRATRLARQRGLIGGAAPKPTAQIQGDLKLYQPAQNRFYMVAAQLVCERPGLPDRRITAAKQERTRFVLRRLVPPDGTSGEFSPEAADVEEYAFVAYGDGGQWRKLNAAERARLLPDEERQGLFPTSYDTGGRKRRLLLGNLPVARIEAYTGAPPAEADGTVAPPDDADLPSPLALLWRTEVSAPWTALIERADVLERMLLEEEPSTDLSPSNGELARTGKALIDDFRARAATIGWFILSDTRQFLQTHLPVLWDDLNGRLLSRALTPGEVLLKTAMEAIEAGTDLVQAYEDDYPAYTDKVYGRFVDALTAISDSDILLLERAETSFEWPAGSSPTSGWPAFVWIAAHPAIEVDANVAPTSTPGWHNDDWRTPGVDDVSTLEDRIEGALPATPIGPVPELAAPAAIDRAAEPWFTVRCVFERPNCEGFADTVVSAPSAPFRMARFFDPDAPTRDLRIPMPVDISPAGLRKYRKGAGFVLSDMFCGQINRFKKTTFGDLVLSVLPWPFHKDLPSGGDAPCKSGGNAFGLFISLSIPIVTICAFILMIIMVTLLDIVFRWLPYLLVVFRIPLTKGTKE